VRLDVGWRVPGAQFPGEENFTSLAHAEANLFLFQFPGAVHLTIGEAF
jgi:hypothetical protein